jgi:hypothetical protein
MIKDLERRSHIEQQHHNSKTLELSQDISMLIELNDSGIDKL